MSSSPLIRSLNAHTTASDPILTARSLDRLRRIPSDFVASLLTRNDPMPSRANDPSAFMSRLLSPGGKRSEPGPSRPVERHSPGPLALMRRVVALLERARTQHDRLRHSRTSPDGISASDPPSLDAALRRVMHVACYPCDTCGEPYLWSVTADGEYEANLRGLAEYVKHPEPDTRIIALECITTLAVAHDAARTCFIDLGIMGDLADCEYLAQKEAHRGWRKVFIPANQCIEVLSHPPTSSPILSPIAERLGLGIQSVVRRLRAALEASQPDGISQLNSDGAGSPRRSSDPPARSIVQMACCLPLGSQLSSWDTPSPEVKSGLSTLLQFTRHGDPTVRHIAIDHIALLAFTHSSFRAWFNECDALSLLEDTLLAAKVEPGGEWAALKHPTDACLAILRGPSLHLQSEPPISLSWNAVLAYPDVHVVFRTLIAAVDVPGLASTFACMRLRSAFAQGSFSNTFNAHMLALLADTLTPPTVTRWWTLYARSRPVQQLLVALYDGAADWLGFLQWPPTPTLRLWLFECLQLPLLRQMSDDATRLRTMSPRSRGAYTAHPLRAWVARLQKSADHIPGFEGALAADVRAMRQRVADAIDGERLPLPRDALGGAFWADGARAGLARFAPPCASPMWDERG